MSSQQQQIQALIDEIDAVLRAPSPRPRWFAAKPAEPERPLLERVRRYLVFQRQAVAVNRSAPSQPASPTADSTVTAAQAALQTLTQEMRSLRGSVLQPLRGEVFTLMQQRDALQQEIHQLQLQKPSSALEPAPSLQLNQALINEFLQVLMARFQDNLSQQIAQVLETYPVQPLQDSTPVNPALPEPGEALALAAASEQLEQIQTIHDRTHQILADLNTAITATFAHLQQQVETRQADLEKGLDNMQSLGQRGETMIADLVKHLSQQAEVAAARPPISLAAPSPVPPEPTPVGTASELTESPVPLPPDPAIAPLPIAPPPLVSASHDHGLPFTTTVSRDSGRKIALPYPGTEWVADWAKDAGRTGAQPAIAANEIAPEDQISTLTDLFLQLTNPEAPVVVSTLPPALEFSEPEGVADSAAEPLPPPMTAEVTVGHSIFTLEGMDDLFLDTPEVQR